MRILNRMRGIEGLYFRFVAKRSFSNRGYYYHIKTLGGWFSSFSMSRNMICSRCFGEE